MALATVFKPDYERYEGGRPIQVSELRLGYLLVFICSGCSSLIPWGDVFRTYLRNQPGPGPRER